MPRQIEAQDSEPRPPRRWLPPNGRARQVIKWTAIVGFFGSVAAFIIAVERIWPYRPVFAKNFEAHAKADISEHKALEARTDDKIQKCLDEIRKLREDEKTELRRQNEILRQALANMGGTS